MQANNLTIKLGDLRLVTQFANLRKVNGGRTCQLAATTPAPMLQGECRPRRAPRVLTPGEQARMAMQTVFVGPMQRGRVGDLVARVQREHGPREVRTTWGAPAKALLAEPRHVLNGGNGLAA
jgi:hypothetical protein